VAQVATLVYCEVADTEEPDTRREQSFIDHIIVERIHHLSVDMLFRATGSHGVLDTPGYVLIWTFAESIIIIGDATARPEKLAAEPAPISLTVELGISGHLHHPDSHICPGNSQRH
jgi:hypothetical protein